MEAEVRRIVLEVGDVRLLGHLGDTPTADQIWQALPLEGSVYRWGDELAFPVSLDLPLELNARQVVEPGTLCFWCEGSAVAIPFGPSPISLREECRLAAPFNQWGRLDSDGTPLAGVASGQTIRLARYRL